MKFKTRKGIKWNGWDIVDEDGNIVEQHPRQFLCLERCKMLNGLPYKEVVPYTNKDGYTIYIDVKDDVVVDYE